MKIYVAYYGSICANLLFAQSYTPKRLFKSEYSDNLDQFFEIKQKTILTIDITLPDTSANIDICK